MELYIPTEMWFSRFVVVFPFKDFLYESTFQLRSYLALRLEHTNINDGNDGKINPLDHHVVAHLVKAFTATFPAWIICL